MTEIEAKLFLEDFLNKNYDPSDVGRLVVIDGFTLRKPYGWVFRVNTEMYVNTRDIRYACLGNGPIIVTDDQMVHILPADEEPEAAIAHFESKQQ